MSGADSTTYGPVGLPLEGLPADELFISVFGRVRIVTCVAPLLVVVFGVLAGGTFLTIRSSALVLLIAILTVLCIARPDSDLGLCLVVVIGLYWAITVHDRLSVWVLPAALCLLLVHTSLAASTTSPVDRPTNATRDRWSRRTAIVAAITVGVWAATYVFGHVTSPTSVILSALGFVVVCAIALLVRSGSWTDDPPRVETSSR
jgi:hypothetical protein